MRYLGIALLMALGIGGLFVCWPRPSRPAPRLFTEHVTPPRFPSLPPRDKAMARVALRRAVRPSKPRYASRGSATGTTFSVTAYCPCRKCCGSYANGTTATGRKATKGVCAVDPRVIPLGTKLYIPGYGYAIAADTGGAIKGNRIDVCFDSHAEALAWGRRSVRVTRL